MHLRKIGEADAVQALAQNRFERVLPAFPDPDSLPQVRIAAQFVAFKPGFDFAPAGHLLLQRLQRGEPGVELVETLLGLLGILFRSVHRRFQHGQVSVALFECIALFVEPLSQLPDLRFQPYQFTEVRHFQAITLFFQSRVPRFELLQQLLAVASAGFFQLQLLFGLGQPALRLGKLRLRAAIRLFGGRQGTPRGLQLIGKRRHLPARLRH